MSKHREDPAHQITFEYKISPNYTVYGISGVFGGVNGQGQIIMNFFNERHPIPKMQTFPILENGSVGNIPIEEDRKKHAIRDVLLAISISPSTARSFAGWLIDKADQFEKILQAQEKKSDVKTATEHN